MLPVWAAHVSGIVVFEPVVYVATPPPPVLVILPQLIDEYLASLFLAQTGGCRFDSFPSCPTMRRASLTGSTSLPCSRLSCKLSPWQILSQNLMIHLLSDLPTYHYCLSLCAGLGHRTCASKHLFNIPFFASPWTQRQDSLPVA